jgi:hypothetical protein
METLSKDMEWVISGTEWKKLQPYDTLPRKTIIQNSQSSQNLTWKAETKIVYDHRATTTEDSTRNSAHRRWKQAKPWKDGKHQTIGEEKQAVRE